MQAEKILKTIPLVKRIMQAESISFSAESNNGFFLSVFGNKILEFDNIDSAEKAAFLLNQVIDPIKKSYVADYEKKVDDILNA